MDELALNLGQGLGCIGHQQTIRYIQHVTSLWCTELEVEVVDECA
jgi:hypothetical protein